MSAIMPSSAPQLEISPILSRSECNDLGIERLEIAPPAEVSAGGALHKVFVQAGVVSAVDELAARWRARSTYKTGPVELWTLRNAYLESRMCVAIKQGKYVPDTLRGGRQAVENGYTHVKDQNFCIPRRRIRSVAGAALLVGSPVGRNYFHWLFEVIPRWLLARDKISTDTQIVVPKLRSMEESALEAAGVHSNSILLLPEDENLLVDRLIVGPCGIQGSAGIVPAAVDALKSITGDTGDQGERLYVSRRGARRRRVANEAEMQDVLSRYGFREIQPGDLSVGAQVSEFAKASVILGMHGAGLANSVFAPAGATVIELQPVGLDGARIALYWNLSAVAGHRYVQVICREADHQEGRGSRDRDMVVDVTQLERVLTKILPDHRRNVNSLIT